VGVGELSGVAGSVIVLYPAICYSAQTIVPPAAL
jgi:hypothetical protein